MPVDMGEIIDDTKTIASHIVGDIGSFHHLTSGTVITDDLSLLLTSWSTERFSSNQVAGRPPVRPDCRVLQLLPAGGGGRGPGTDDAGRRGDLRAGSLQLLPQSFGRPDCRTGNIELS